MDATSRNDARTDSRVPSSSVRGADEETGETSMVLSLSSATGNQDRQVCLVRP